MKNDQIKALLKECNQVTDEALDEFITELRKVIPERTEVVTTEQAAAIWNLRSKYIYGIDKSRYSGATIRGRSKSPTDPLHKLTEQERVSHLGANITGRSFFLLRDVLTIYIRPWKNAGCSKPLWMDTSDYKPKGKERGKIARKKEVTA